MYPKPADMWERWAFAASAGPCEAAVEPPWWERHGIGEPTGCTQKLKEIATLDRQSGVWRLN